MLLTYKYPQTKYRNVIKLNHRVKATAKKRCSHILTSNQKENIFR